MSVLARCRTRVPLFRGYVIGAAVMMIGGAVGWFLGVDAERQSLGDIATPMSARGTGGATGEAASAKVG